MNQPTNKTLLVTKRDGTLQELDIDKIHKVVEYACEGLSDVFVSEVEIEAQLKFFNKMSTNIIQETLIQAASNLISEDSPNYQYVAGRLVNYDLRKKVFGKYIPDHLYDHVKKIVAKGFYTKELLEWYSENEYKELNDYLDHDKDKKQTYAAMETWRKKYLVQNRVNGEIYETPQIANMLIAMVGFANYPKDKRLDYVKRFYDSLSDHKISLPTPIMAGLRTSLKQFSSCVLIESGDSLDSITETTSAIVKYVAQRAGIGIGAGRIRAIGSPIRNGEVHHTGILPYLKLFYAAVASCNQGGIRKGSSTFYYPIWHLEVKELLTLKNNAKLEANTVRHSDHAFMFNKLFYERLIEGKDITLFSPKDIPDVEKAFYSKNNELFKELYEKAEKNPKLRKEKVKAIDLFELFIKERKDTGRIYLLNVDHANSHGAFKDDVAPISQSNLCCEILLPVKPMAQEDSLIALCTLAATNWGKINKKEDFEEPCDLTVRFLDEILDYQNYPVKEAERHTKYYRPLGVGIVNFAYFLAKNNASYEGDENTLKLVNEYAEAWSYYLTKASIQLAKEKGSCEKFEHTKYSDGLFPKDTYKKDVDGLVENTLKMDWGSLKEQLLETGIRNSTLMAVMPAETSALISNSTNGIEPIKSYITTKGSPTTGYTKQVAPAYPKLKNKYQLLYDLKSPVGYLKIMAVLQKYIDQTISTNTSYNPENYPNRKVSMQDLLQHILFAYKYGITTLYYNNTADGAGEKVNFNETENKPEAQSDEDGCVDGCKL